MHRIALFSSARSEYWALTKVVNDFASSDDFSLSLILSGTHLSSRFGMSINDKPLQHIGKTEVYSFPYLLDGESSFHLSDSVGLGIINLSSVLDKVKPDLMIVAGDRYDLLIPASCSVLFKIPIAHLGGGQITYGAIDNDVRNCITKLSHIHIATTTKAALNISMMGEEDWRIVVSGSPTIDNLYDELLKRDEIEENLGTDLKKEIILCTYHPATRDLLSYDDQIDAVLGALEAFVGRYTVIFTAPGADEGYNSILNKISSFCDLNEDALLYIDLGSKLYASILSQASVIVGNSSSGIIEAPTLRVPTVNIGNRQLNRERAGSVLDSGYSVTQIVETIQYAFESRNALDYSNPYDPFMDGRNHLRVLESIRKLISEPRLYNKRLDFEVNECEWNRFI